MLREGRGVRESLWPAMQGREVNPSFCTLAFFQLPSDDEAFRHARIRGKSQIQTGGSGNAQDVQVRVPLCEHLSKTLPRQAGRRGQREHQGQDAAGLELAVGQRGERRRDAGVAVGAGVLSEGVDAGSHGRLVCGRGVECGKRGVRHCGMRALVVGGASERWVHHDQVEAGVGDVRHDVGRGLLAHAAGTLGRVAGIEQGVRDRALQQFQRPDADAAVRLAAIGQRVQPRLAEVHCGLHPGQGGTGDVDGGRHDVTAVQHVFHHHGVQAGRVSPSAFVPGGDLLVHRGQQGAGAAGEVADAQGAERVGIGPMYAVQLGRGQPRQQGRGFGARVERSEIFAVGDEPLKQPAGQVVRDDGAACSDALRGFAQDLQEAGRGVRRQLFHDVAGNREHGPIVDVQNAPPRIGHGPLRVGDGRAAHPMQRFDGGVPAGQSLVIQHGVGDDGARHAAGLDVVGHAEQAGDVQRDAGPRRRHVVEQGDPAVNTFFQRLRRRGDGTLRHGDEADQVGQIGHGAGEPACGGKPLHLLPILRQHAVGQVRRGDGDP